MSRELKRVAALTFAASMVPPPLPVPPASMFENRAPSGKDRSKVKAARKQSRKTRRKSN